VPDAVVVGRSLYLSLPLMDEQRRRGATGCEGLRAADGNGWRRSFSKVEPVAGWPLSLFRKLTPTRYQSDTGGQPSRRRGGVPCVARRCVAANAVTAERCRGTAGLRCGAGRSTRSGDAEMRQHAQHNHDATRCRGSEAGCPRPSAWGRACRGSTRVGYWKPELEEKTSAPVRAAGRSCRSRRRVWCRFGVGQVHVECGSPRACRSLSDVVVRELRSGALCTERYSRRKGRFTLRLAVRLSCVGPSGCAVKARRRDHARTEDRSALRRKAGDVVEMVSWSVPEVSARSKIGWRISCYDARASPGSSQFGGSSSLFRVHKGLHTSRSKRQ